MALVDLPDTPGPAQLDWQLMDFNTRLRPPFGGKIQKLRRLGKHYKVNVQLPPMNAAIAGDWIAALERGLDDDVRWRLRQVGMEGGLPGSPVVSGGAQAGRFLVAEGFTPNYSISAGWKFAVQSGGQRYLYTTDAPFSADAVGVATIPMTFSLQAPPADGDMIEFALPHIEGMLDEGPLPWTITNARTYGLVFSIEEFG